MFYWLSGRFVTSFSYTVFSSPESNSQVSFFDRNLSVIFVALNFLHFHLLLQNQRTNFNQNWHKADWGKGNWSCSTKRPSPFLREDNCEIVKIYWCYLKNLFLQNHITNLHQTWLKAFLGELNLNLFKWKPTLSFQGEIIVT